MTFMIESSNVCIANLYRSFELKQNGLRDEDLAGFSAKVTDLSLEQLNLLSWSAASDLEQSIYDRVQVYLVFRHSCAWLVAACSVDVVGEEGLARKEGESAR